MSATVADDSPASQSPFLSLARASGVNCAVEPYFTPDLLDNFETMLDDARSSLDLPAAIIIETVKAEGGINVASIA